MIEVEIVRLRHMEIILGLLVHECNGDWNIYFYIDFLDVRSFSSTIHYKSCRYVKDYYRYFATQKYRCVDDIVHF